MLSDASSSPWPLTGLHPEPDRGGRRPARPTHAADVPSISFMTFSGRDPRPPRVELDKISRGFGAANGPYALNYPARLVRSILHQAASSIAGNSAPDTFELDYQDFVSYASKGALLNLATMGPPCKANYDATYYPRAVDAFRANGAQYGLPESFSDVLLFYNKDPLGRGPRRLPDGQLDVGRRDQRGQEADGERRYGDYEPVQFSSSTRCSRRRAGNS